MPQHVCNGAALKCMFGQAPSTFVVLPKNMTLTGNQPAANIMDHIPMMKLAEKRASRRVSLPRNFVLQELGYNP